MTDWKKIDDYSLIDQIATMIVLKLKLVYPNSLVFPIQDQDNPEGDPVGVMAMGALGDDTLVINISSEIKTRSEVMALPIKSPKKGIPLLTSDEYVKHKGLICPHCSATEPDIEGSSIEIDAGYAWQNVMCLNCDGEWRDLYDLSGYEEI